MAAILNGNYSDVLVFSILRNILPLSDNLSMKPSTQLTLLILLSSIVGISGCNSQAPVKSAGDSANLPSATVAQVLYEEITELDDYTGRLSAPERVELRARVSGYIDQVLFKEGSMVEQGDLLFSIDSASFKAELKRSEAQLAAAKSMEVNARSEFDRAKRLIDKNAIARELFEERRAQLLSASAELKAAQANLSLAQLNVDYTGVKAPIAGRVSNALFTKGNFINAGQSILTTIVSTDKIYAYFDADERTYLKYSALEQSGQRSSSRDSQRVVLMGLASDDKFPYHGHINFIDNNVNPLTSTIRGRAVFENTSGNLIPGLFARIRVPGSAAYKAILIDEKAIGTDLDTKFVLTIDSNNIIKRQPIVLGAQFSGLRIIKQGLQADDKIVVSGLQRLRSDTQVKPIIEAMASDNALQHIRERQAFIQNRADVEAVAKKTDSSASTGG